MSYKKVLLVFPDISERLWHKGYFHYGLAHISSYLKGKINDLDISLLTVRDKNFSLDEFSKLIEEFEPQIVGFTSTTHSFPIAQKMAGWIKEINNNILSVCGGIHVTINPNEALITSEFDVIVCGDGEYPMELLVNEWVDHGRIPDDRGILYRKDGKMVDNGLARVSDTESLPDPDWELFDYMNLDDGSQGIGGLMMSRGCPYQCTYCCNHKIDSSYKDNNERYTRFKSVDKGITEIQNFVSKYPKIHTLYFDDDILPLKRKWFLEFAERYRNEINKPFWCNIRPNLVDEEIVDAFVRAGCVRAGIGIESGNAKIRNEILRRNISDETIIDAVSLLKKKKIYVYTFNMVGIPKETKGELMDTIRFNAKVQSDKMQCSVFYPYKHTALYDLIVREGLYMSERSLMEYTSESILNFDYPQKNRIYFTVLTMNIIVKIYKMLPGCISEIFLKVIYSNPSAMSLLPLLNMVSKKMLTSKSLTNVLRYMFRHIIPPPPTAMSQ